MNRSATGWARAAGLTIAIIAGALSGNTRALASSGNAFPHNAMSGFSMPAGAGFWVAYANGSVAPYAAAVSHGDAAGEPLHAPISSGASARDGKGYWLTGWDGGVFTFGSARFYGSMGAHRLNQPVFAMTPTASGRGYWLVAFDGGIFAFGDAGFYGSTGNLRLNRPIAGITTSPSGRGYRMVARDGGIFSFGDAPFYGSLPALGIHVTDVVGMAPTPTNKGYWVVRSDGRVYRFGDAPALGAYTALACDRVTSIFSNPTAPGYRLVTQSGATIPFGQAPGGTRMTGHQHPCVAQTACRPALQSAADYQALFNTRGPIWDGADGAGAVDLGDGRRLWLFGDTFSGPTNATNILPGFRFLRNSLAVEQGRCMEFRLGGPPTPSWARTDVFGASEFDRWYWPMDGVVDQAAGLARLSVMRLAPSFGRPGYAWRVVRNEVLSLDLKSLAVRAAVPMPTPNGLLWGSSMVQVGTTVYLYARTAGGAQYAARTTLTHLSDGQWEFFDGSSWSSDPSAAHPMKFELSDGSNDAGPNPAVSVERYGSGFLASAKRCDVFCLDLSAWYSPSAAGPWKAVNANGGLVASTKPGVNQVTYGGHLVPIGSHWLAVWSVNRTVDSTLKYMYGTHVATPVNLPDADTLATEYASTPATGSASLRTATTAPVTSPPDRQAATSGGSLPYDLPTSGGWTQR